VVYPEAGNHPFGVSGEEELIVASFGAIRDLAKMNCSGRARSEISEGFFESVMFQADGVCSRGNDARGSRHERLIAADIRPMPNVVPSIVAVCMQCCVSGFVVVEVADEEAAAVGGKDRGGVRFAARGATLPSPPAASRHWNLSCEPELRLCAYSSVAVRKVFPHEWSMLNMCEIWL
jgi:hypothetical protein